MSPPEDGPSSVWTTALPTLCLIVAVALVSIVAPPSKLVEFVGSDVWSRLGLGVVVFLVLIVLLMSLGLAAGKVGLPFGLSFESGGSASKTVADVGTHLRELRQADERIFERLGEITLLVEQALERVADLERDIGGSGK